MYIYMYTYFVVVVIHFLLICLYTCVIALACLHKPRPRVVHIARICCPSAVLSKSE